METGYSQVLKPMNSGRALSWCRQTRSQGSTNLYICDREVGPQLQIIPGKGWDLPNQDGRARLEANITPGAREALLRTCHLKSPQLRGPHALPGVSYLTLPDPCMSPPRQRTTEKLTSAVAPVWVSSPSKCGSTMPSVAPSVCPLCERAPH